MVVRQMKRETVRATASRRKGETEETNEFRRLEMERQRDSEKAVKRVRESRMDEREKQREKGDRERGGGRCVNNGTALQMKKIRLGCHAQCHVLASDRGWGWPGEGGRLGGLGVEGLGGRGSGEAGIVAFHTISTYIIRGF